MPRRLVAAAVLVAGIGAAWLLLRGDGPQTDEAQIRALFRDAAEKASERDIAGVIEHVAPTYSGEAGDRAALKRYLLGYTLRAEWVQAFERVEDLSIEGSRATAVLGVLLARAKATGIDAVDQGAVVGTHRIETVLDKIDVRWLVVQAQRNRGG